MVVTNSTVARALIDVHHQGVFEVMWNRLLFPDHAKQLVQLVQQRWSAVFEHFEGAFQMPSVWERVRSQSRMEHHQNGGYAKNESRACYIKCLFIHRHYFQDSVLWLYSFTAFSHLTPACNAMDRMLISIRRPMSYCSLNNYIDCWLADWRVCGRPISCSSTLTDDDLTPRARRKLILCCN